MKISVPTVEKTSLLKETMLLPLPKVVGLNMGTLFLLASPATVAKGIKIYSLGTEASLAGLRRERTR